MPEVFGKAPLFQITHASGLQGVLHVALLECLSGLLRPSLVKQSVKAEGPNVTHRHEAVGPYDS